MRLSSLRNHPSIYSSPKPEDRDSDAPHSEEAHDFKHKGSEWPSSSAPQTELEAQNNSFTGLATLVRKKKDVYFWALRAQSHPIRIKLEEFVEKIRTFFVTLPTVDVILPTHTNKQALWREHSLNSTH